MYVIYNMSSDDITPFYTIMTQLSPVQYANVCVCLRISTKRPVVVSICTQLAGHLLTPLRPL